MDLRILEEILFSSRYTLLCGSGPGGGGDHDGIGESGSNSGRIPRRPIASRARLREPAADVFDRLSRLDQRRPPAQRKNHWDEGLQVCQHFLAACGAKA